MKDVWSGNCPGLPILPKTVTDYLIDLRERLAVAADIADMNAIKSQEAYKHQYNKRAKPKSFVVGDNVIVFEKDTGNKLLSKWTGPCEIVKQVSDNSYLVSMPNTGRRTFHANHLRKYVSETQLTGFVNNPIVKAAVNLVGVIDDHDTEGFGEVVEIPSFAEKIVIDDNDFVSLVRETCSHLSDCEQRQLVTVLQRHSAVFSTKPGLCNVGQHTIRVQDNVPVPRRKLYPVPLILRDEVDKQVADLLEADIIEPSMSPYAHPVVCPEAG